MKLLLLFVVAITTCACSSPQYPLTGTAAAGLKGRLVATTARRPTPFFVGGSNANALFVAGGLVSVAAMSAATSDTGAGIVRENGIPDPAPYIAQELSKDFVSRYGLKRSEQALYITDDDPKHITALHPAADVLIDVSIDSISLEPFPDKPSKYRVSFTARLRLIDAKVVHPLDDSRGVVIAEGTCSCIPTSSSLTYDELLADNAERLKEKLANYADSCVDVFQAKVLNVNPAP